MRPDELPPAAVRRPTPLREGDRVAVLSPSGPILPGTEDRLEAGLDLLRSWGLRPEVGDHARAVHGHLAGNDLHRAMDLNTALHDPGVRAVFATRGGYGASRTADLADWERLRRDPIWLVGFSDVTGLHVAAWQRTRTVTLHGPFVGRMALVPEAQLERLRGYLTGHLGQGTTLDLAGEALAGGSATGRLLGGNLALLCSLVGTVDELDPRGAVLVLEDVGEAPYRIDRMLMHLLRAGALDEVEAVVVGRFTGCEPPDDRPSATVAEVVDEVLGGLGIPVLVDAAIGHLDAQVPLPLGVLVSLDAGAGTLTLLEDVAGGQDAGSA